MDSHFIIDYRVYPFEVLISVHENYNDLSNILKKHLPKNNWSHIKEFKVFDFDARTVIFPNGATCIVFKKYCFENHNLGIIAHEAIHAVNFLFKHIGICYALDNDEHLAYTVQFLVDEIIKGYEQLKVK